MFEQRPPAFAIIYLLPTCSLLLYSRPDDPLFSHVLGVAVEVAVSAGMTGKRRQGSAWLMIGAAGVAPLCGKVRMNRSNITSSNATK